MQALRNYNDSITLAFRPQASKKTHSELPDFSTSVLSLEIWETPGVHVLWRQSLTIKSKGKQAPIFGTI